MDLLDLQLINERYGRDSLPYPFMLTRPTRFEFVDEVAKHAAQLPDRLRSGDLSAFARCLDALPHADVTVAGHVQYIPADTPSIRVLAFRTGQAGYLLEQRADADVVDVYTVSPFELGAAIATAMSLEEPGRHPRIVIPEYVPIRPAVVDDGAVVVRHEVITEPGVKVSVSQLSAYAKVQSNWRPAREWGIDARKESLIWMRMKDDGDYLGVPDRSRGIPLTTALLSERIDGLIAADIEMLREARGER
ncbi:ESX secretion-associated protein EspG [Mycolicibacterium baixiangningiae]|uniref:ESX secretion-associated protein EspG n=1 Tax=Mycolicibacterium baixiangningiae TaxID=2761578 RepID=UPI0018D10BAE|nr:ESX secretion-associated protein EspG [Mycolicibacterium baixiangningiae]